MAQESLKQRQAAEVESTSDLSPVSRAKDRFHAALDRLGSAVEARLEQAIIAEESARAAAHEATQAVQRSSSEDASAWEAKLAAAEEKIAKLSEANDTLAEEKISLGHEIKQRDNEQLELRDLISSVSQTLEHSIGKVEALLKE